MRITDKGVFDAANISIEKNRERFQEASNRAATGVRVQHAWEDPAASAIAVSRRMAEAKQSALAAAMSRTADELQSADQALDSMNQLVTRARELAVQLGNDTYSAPDRVAGGTEIASIRSALIALGNTEVNGRYLFAGNQDRIAPFDGAGNYLGDDGARQIELAPGVWNDIAVRGDVALVGTGGGTDVLATLAALSAAMTANDVPAIRNSLDALSAATAQIGQTRSQVGASQSVLDAASSAAASAKLQATADIGRELDADPFQAASDLALAQRGLEASLEASAKSFQPTLLGKI